MNKGQLRKHDFNVLMWRLAGLALGNVLMCCISWDSSASEGVEGVILIVAPTRSPAHWAKN